jgi:plasmid stabilization system protein ParE
MSLTTIEWTQNALDAVREHACWLRDNTARSPSGWIDTLFSRVESLREFPAMGAPWQRSAASGLRQLVVGRHVVIYHFSEDECVQVLAVRHHAQGPVEIEGDR